MIEEKEGKVAVKKALHLYHRFLDEAGDTTFYGKGRIPLIGSEGVSTHFVLGMLTLNESVESVRSKIIDLQTCISDDPYFDFIPSISKKKSKAGFFLHAKDDVPEVRKMAFEMIRTIDCRLDVVVGRKDYGIYEKKHNGSQAEFYADLLAYLLTDNLNEYERLVLNIAHRSQCTTHRNFEKGLEKAKTIAINKFPENNNWCKIGFNVQTPTFEPIINITDYLLWAVQRKIEKNEERYFHYCRERIGSVQFLYADDET